MESKGKGAMVQFWLDVERFRKSMTQQTAPIFESQYSSVNQSTPSKPCSTASNSYPISPESNSRPKSMASLQTQSPLQISDSSTSVDLLSPSPPHHQEKEQQQHRRDAKMLYNKYLSPKLNHPLQGISEDARIDVFRTIFGVVRPITADSFANVQAEVFKAMLKDAALVEGDSQRKGKNPEEQSSSSEVRCVGAEDQHQEKSVRCETVGDNGDGSFEMFVRSPLYYKYLDVLLSSGSSSSSSGGAAITLADVLRSDRGLFYFLVFMDMQIKTALTYVQFWLAADKYRYSVAVGDGDIEAQIEVASKNGVGNDRRGSCQRRRDEAMVVYSQFISLQANPRVKLPGKMRREIENRICQPDKGPNRELFVEAQEFVYANLDTVYFTKFKRSNMFTSFKKEVSSLAKREDVISPETAKEHCGETANAPAKERSTEPGRQSIKARLFGFSLRSPPSSSQESLHCSDEDSRKSSGTPDTNPGMVTSDAAESSSLDHKADSLGEKRYSKRGTVLF